ncbi:MAG: hypothetical protein Q8P24_04195 [Desulfobacterales bacterium]|nr:hypothetical protein [Desulfobacterales bacterium]
MLPFIFEWIWDMSHMVFMGGVGFSLAVIGLGMAYCVIKAVMASIHNRPGTHH